MELHNPYPIVGTEINKIFGDKALFENASFQIPLGAKVALTGGNGTGKTTLIQMILNHEEGTSISPKAKIATPQTNATDDVLDVKTLIGRDDGGNDKPQAGLTLGRAATVEVKKPGLLPIGDTDSTKKDSGKTEQKGQAEAGKADVAEVRESAPKIPKTVIDTVKTGLGALSKAGNIIDQSVPFTDSKGNQCTIIRKYTNKKREELMTIVTDNEGTSWNVDKDIITGEIQKIKLDATSPAPPYIQKEFTDPNYIPSLGPGIQGVKIFQDGWEIANYTDKKYGFSWNVIKRAGSVTIRQNKETTPKIRSIF